MVVIDSALGIAVRLGKPHLHGGLRGGVGAHGSVARVPRPWIHHLGRQLDRHGFIVRSEAKSRPEGWRENLFPLITVFVPIIGFMLLFLPQVRQHVPGYSAETLEMLKGLTPMFGFYVNMLGVTNGFIGAALSIWAISFLKKSFGLRAAVRKLVTNGPYARIRHPLCVGEIIHLFGIAILSLKPFGLYLFILAVSLQVVRARIEEQKFLRTLPEYEEYMRQTGFLWPRIRRT